MSAPFNSTRRNLLLGVAVLCAFGMTGNEALAQAVGDVDLDFNPAFWGGQSAIAVQRDGKVLVAALGGVLRLNQDGSRDDSFHGIHFGPYPFIFTQAYVVYVQADGRILFGGGVIFSGYQQVQNFVSRVEADGTGENRVIVDISSDGGVHCLHVQQDGKILAGGNIGYFSGGYNLARLESDLSPDPAWPFGISTSGASGGRVAAVTSERDGKIILGGGFTQIDGVNRNRFARLNIDGTLDETFFNPGASNGCDGDIHRIAMLPDGKILVAGQFSTIQGAAKPFLARLNADGTVSANFPASSGPDGSVLALAVQSDGRIIIGGDFTHVDGLSRPHIARLLANGAVDESFDPGLGPDGPVYDLTVLPDGDLIIFGGFGMVNGIPRTQIARLHCYQLRLEPPNHLSNGNVRVLVHGQPATRFILQTSADLQNWSPLSTNSFITTTSEFTDTNAAPGVSRFYRALSTE